MDNLTALEREFRAFGFVLIRHSKHKIWRCPCGHAQITSSSTRHGGRGDQNARAMLARTRRVCTQRLQEAKAA